MKFQLLFQKVAIATLGGSEYGLYQLAASIINYMSVMDLGFNNGIVNYTAKYRATGKEADMKKLYLVGNSHIDPVWLWRYLHPPIWSALEWVTYIAFSFQLFLSSI